MKEITFRDLLLCDLQALPADRKKLLIITNPLEYEWRTRSIEDRERLLNQLNTEERFLIERIVINREKAAALTTVTGLSVKEIYYAKEDAMDRLLTLRHGAAYRP